MFSYFTGNRRNKQYTALAADSTDRIDYKSSRCRAQSTCMQYLQFVPRYTMITHLNDIGSRFGKHWFAVTDTSMSTDRILTLTPPSKHPLIVCQPSTRRLIRDLFYALQHPYVYPILDLEFVESPTENNSYTIMVLPFNKKGSLKDYIYQSCWYDSWTDKYSNRGSGLPDVHVRYFARQILEALIFLKDMGYTYSFHLHSGNVMIQNGMARVCGLENVVLGYTSRIQPVIIKNQLLRKDPWACEIICFGHILFEMIAGYELTEPEPTAVNMLDTSRYPEAAAVLDFIFKNPEGRAPALEELLLIGFFRKLELREMRTNSLPLLKAHLTNTTKMLLSKIKERHLKMLQHHFKSNPDWERSLSIDRDLAAQLAANGRMGVTKFKSCDDPEQNNLNLCGDFIEDLSIGIDTEEHRGLNLHKKLREGHHLSRIPRITDFSYY